MSIKRDLEFLFEMGCLRFVERTWRQFLNPDFANLSEHTLRVIWISLVIAKHEAVADLGKIVKMAIVHDISESRSVDVHYLSRQYVDRFEQDAIKQTLSGTILEEEFITLWNEYEKRKSIEAKIVKDADNLDVDLELKEQEYCGHKISKSWTEMRQRVFEKKLFTNTAKKIWRLIKNSNPHDWHINGKNRYTDGDWKTK